MVCVVYCYAISALGVWQVADTKLEVGVGVFTYKLRLNQAKQQFATDQILRNSGIVC